MSHDLKNVSAKYGVSVSTVSSWICNGELAAVNVSRNPASRKPRWRVTDEALAEFEKSRAAVTPTLKPPRRRRNKDDDGIIEFYKVG